MTLPLRVEMTDKIASFQELLGQEKKKNPDEAKKDAQEALIKLKKSLAAFNELQFTNPLRLDVSDPLGFGDKITSASRRLVELLHRASYKNMHDFEADIKYLDELKDILPYQAQGKPPIEDWRFDFVHALRSLKPTERVTDFVFHLHSLYDICEDCAPTLAREWERHDGFLMRFKSWIIAFNGEVKMQPSAHLLTSCSNIRKVAKDRFSSPTFSSISNPKQIIFTQTYMPPPTGETLSKGASAESSSSSFLPPLAVSPTAANPAKTLSVPASTDSSGSSVIKKEDEKNKDSFSSLLST
ncbi:MAG: hypothetical protein FJX71_04205 [Alphaproteobacteria bacterium]|nr:hypothetical protein [Alphaproteobacteria bacterium]